MKPFVIALLLLAALSSGALAQKAPATPPAANNQQTITVNVDLVNVQFTVADKKGRLQNNLAQEDFQIFEDNKLQTISHFGSEDDLPLVIGLVIDSSASIRDQLQFEQDAASEFFFDMLRKGKDKAFVIGFDTGVNVHQDLTDDPERLAQAVKKIRSGGGTSLFDAISLATSEKLARENIEGRRRVLIVISDGDDNSSKETMDDVLELAQKENVTIYTISTNSLAYFGSRSQERGDTALKKLATETGGRPLFPEKLDDLHDSFRQIIAELRHQYAISYFSKNSKRDGTFRKIRIQVANPDFKANARKGYYAQKPPATAPQR